MKLWFQNNIKRHWINFVWRITLYPEWIREGRDPSLFPRLGKTQKADIEWAKQVIKELSLP